MQDEHVVLVFDVGTQSARAMLVNSNGETLGKCKKAYDKPYWSDAVDWAEQDADFYYDCMCEAAQACKAQFPDAWKKIEAVSFTTIRDTVICVDKNGTPLRPAIVWLDKRMAKGKPQFSPPLKAALKAIGMESTVNVQYAKSHSNWIREEEPDVWVKTHKFLLLSGYLIFKMTGVFADADAALIGHIPFNNKKRAWDKPSALTFSVFPLEREKMCSVVKSGCIAGYITEKMAADSGLEKGLPVYATGSDKACEVLGLGCIEEDKAAIGLGTTATITYMSPKYVEPERFIPAYAACVPNCWNPEIQIYRGYWLISWFKKEFAAKEVVEAEKRGVRPEQLLDDELKSIPAGCDGLLFQPYFTPNVTMPTARGAMIGFSDVHTRLHLYRAIVEGINFALIDGMKTIEKRTGKKFTSVTLGGGGSQSDEICQITADMFALPVIRTHEFEATGIGCALTAFVGMGVFSDYKAAVSKMVRVENVFEPRQEFVKIYSDLYNNVYKKIYGRLLPLYNTLRDIYHTA
ncbi:MAG: FGGY-family carbohydrate kinase [Treponema sp.]|nr:FGGY-family carbohydrate kinase [Treponema sp.]